MFQRGYIYVGDWHSHPEPVPSPSSLDWKTHESLVQKSTYELNGLLLVIIGQSLPPEGLSVHFVSREGARIDLEE